MQHTFTFATHMDDTHGQHIYSTHKKLHPFLFSFLLSLPQASVGVRFPQSTPTSSCLRRMVSGIVFFASCGWFFSHSLSTEQSYCSVPVVTSTYVLLEPSVTRGAIPISNSFSSLSLSWLLTPSGRELVHLHANHLHARQAVVGQQNIGEYQAISSSLSFRVCKAMTRTTTHEGRFHWLYFVQDVAGSRGNCI